MTGDGRKILIMAGGTGGHIFPAMAIADTLSLRGNRVEWLGAAGGLETRIVGNSNYPLHVISVRGLRGKSLIQLLSAPVMIIRAIVQAMAVIRQVKPHCVLGMGGFATGPGGIAAKLAGTPLVIHEQNGVPGVTNRILAPLANRVLEAFPDTFADTRRAVYTGNPIRSEIVHVGQDREQQIPASRSLRILVLGGSQGAVAVNRLIPPMMEQWDGEYIPEVRHQTGDRNLEETQALYAELAEKKRRHVSVSGFIDDMAEAFLQADLVIGRSGASTVCELASAGLPSILIPYPHHKDKQQTHNAKWLSDAGAALLIEEKDLTAAKLLALVAELDCDRQRLDAMSRAARTLAISDASDRIASHCLEVAHG